MKECLPVERLQFDLVVLGEAIFTNNDEVSKRLIARLHALHAGRDIDCPKIEFNLEPLLAKDLVLDGLDLH